MLTSFQILGYSGGVPTQSRGVTCVIITTTNFDIMIDCGEGSYLNWKKFGYFWKKLRYIIITHMHPDHTGGLLPLLFYRKIMGIKSVLKLIGPPNLKAFILDSFKHTGINQNQNLEFINIENNLNITLDKEIYLTALEMEHKIPCWGYALKDTNHKLVFITDTCRNINAVHLANKADVLIHEATFPHSQIKKAKKHFHTTEVQAMEIADSANVKRLVLTHFSQFLLDDVIKGWTWNGKPCVVFNDKQKI